MTLIVGGWMIWDRYQKASIPIIVKFPNAEGIELNKTVVNFRGFDAGIVTGFSMNKDYTVDVKIDMDYRTNPALVEDSLFWLVKPSISVNGISGLDTILSGSYIKLRDGESKKNKYTFTALSSPPPPIPEGVGLHLTLKSKNLSGLSYNSPVYHKKIPVGKVESYSFSEDNKDVIIKVLIETRYSHLVNESTVFWNASGVNVQANLSGINIDMDSLLTVATGGISFFTPEDTIKKKKEIKDETMDKVFKLYETFLEAKTGAEFYLEIPKDLPVDLKNTPIKKYGIQIGFVSEMEKFQNLRKGRLAKVLLEPQYQGILNAGTQFWLVSPQIKATGLKNVSTLFSGSYITFEEGTNEDASKTLFTLKTQAPPKAAPKGSLVLNLTSKEASGFAPETPILYKGLTIGEVLYSKISDKKTHYITRIYISEKYRDFVNATSYFWKSTGIKLKGNIQNFKVEVPSLQTILDSGVSVITPMQSAAPLSSEQTLPLFNDKEEGEFTEKATLVIKNVSGYTEGVSPVMWNGLKIGLIESWKAVYDKREFIATLKIKKDFRFILNDKTVFFKGTTRISLNKFEGLGHLFSGNTVEVFAGDSHTRKKKFTLSDAPPTSNEFPASYTLISKKLGGLKENSPVLYKGLKIGQVIRKKLNKDDKFEFNIAIKEHFAKRLHRYSKFYRVSGIKLQGSLTNFKVLAENMDSIVNGGVSLINLKKSPSEDAYVTNKNFTLYDDEEAATEQYTLIEVTFPVNSALKVRSPVMFMHQKVGRVKSIKLNKDFLFLKVTLEIARKYSKISREGSRFWIEKAQIGVVKTKNVSSLFTGPFISVIPGNGAPQTQFKGQVEPSPLKSLPNGLNITLSTDHKNSINVGSPVTYREVKVGEVIGVGLSSKAHKVEVYINIYDHFTDLVNIQSRFWITSGVNVDAGIFSGLDIQTESLETILTGGVAFASPKLNLPSVPQGQFFSLALSPEEEWLNWSPERELEKEVNSVR